MINYIYITQAAALDAGLTHEGTLFGVPAWFDGDDDHIAMATPKIPLLHLWCMLCDGLYEMASTFLGTDEVLRSPITVTRRIPLSA